MFHNLRALSRKHRVHLISFLENENEKEHISDLVDMGIRVVTLVRRPSVSHDLLVPKPREHDEYRSRELADLIEETQRQQTFDVIQAEFLQMGQHVPSSLRLLKILTEHEVQFVNCQTAVETETRPLWKLKKFYDWMVQLNYEIEVCRRFDCVVCMTEEDRLALQRFVPAAQLRTIPIGIDSEYFQSSAQTGRGSSPPRLLFVGNYRHTPNREAVHYFVSEILPEVQKVVPDVEFEIVGANADLLDRQSLAASPQVRVVGYVKDIRSYYQQADAFVAPLRSGNGMRVKLLEAFSMGMAVVASSRANLGFCTRDGEHVLLADTKAEFAKQTLRLLKDPTFGQQLGRNARTAITTYYDWKVVEPQFLDLVETRHA
jgi:glycosyltransferase involved in cell wall biosynthesis